MKNLTKSALGIAGFVIFGTLAVASPANAADLPTPTLVKAGQTSTVTFEYKLDGVSIVNVAHPDGAIQLTKWTFNAPPHTSFPAQATVAAARLNSDAGALVPYGDLFTLTGCTVGASGATLTCLPAVPSNVNLGWPQGMRVGFSPVIVVASDAPAGRFAANSVLIMSGNDAAGAKAVSVMNGSLNVAVKPAPPLFTNIGDSTGTNGGLTVIHGTGLAGATVIVTNPAGNTTSSGTVAADGTFEITLDKDYSGTVDDLTMTQAVDGVISDPTTISAADLPMINPTIAIGTGAAVFLAAASFLIRRKRNLA